MLLRQLGLATAGRAGSGHPAPLPPFNRELFNRAPARIRSRVARERMLRAAGQLELGVQLRRRPARNLALALAAGIFIGHNRRLLGAALRGGAALARLGVIGMKLMR